MFGIQTAAAIAGGSTGPPGAVTNVTEHFNGSTWTTVPGTLNTDRRTLTVFGIQTAAVGVGGTTGPAVTNSTEEYNGSVWTAVTNYPLTIQGIGSAGTLTAGLTFGGSPPVTGVTNGYDGTNWSTRPAMGTARQAVAPASAGTDVLTLAAGGTTGAAVTATEEFTGDTSAANIKTVTTS